MKPKDSGLPKFALSIAPLLITIAMVACSTSDIDGKYYAEIQIFGQKSRIEYEFQNNGKVYIKSEMAGIQETNYRTDKDKVIIEDSGKNIVLTKNGDGSLVGKNGFIDIKLIKIDKNINIPTNKELSQLLTDFYSKKSGHGKLTWKKILTISSLEKTNEEILDNSNCKISVFFTVKSKINSAEVESIVTDSDLKTAFGEEYNSEKPSKFIDSIKKSNKKAGENVNDGNNLILSLIKNGKTWEIVKIEENKPKKQ